MTEETYNLDKYVKGEKYEGLLSQPQPHGVFNPTDNNNRGTLEGTTIQSKGKDSSALEGVTDPSSVKKKDTLQGAAAPNDEMDGDSSELATVPGVNVKESETLNLQKVWTRYRVKISLTNFRNEPHLLYNINASEILSPPIMQFLYHCLKKKAETKLKDSFDAYDAYLSDEEMHIICDHDPFKVKRIEMENDFLLSIANCLEIDKLFEASKVNFPSSTMEKIYTKISIENPEKEYHGRVALYQGLSGIVIWVVGFREIVGKVKVELSDLGENLQQGNRSVETLNQVTKLLEYPCDVAKAKDLGIQDYFGQFKFDVKYEEQKIVITGKEKEVTEGRKVLDNFFQDIVTKQVPFPYLCTLDSNEVLNFCKKKVEEQKQYCLLEMKEKNSITVTAASQDIELIINIIKSCVIEERVFKADPRWKFYNSEQFKNIQAKSKGKLSKVNLSGGEPEVLFVYTQDLNEIIQNELERFPALQSSEHKKMPSLGNGKSTGTLGTASRNKTNESLYSRKNGITVKVEMPNVTLNYVNEYMSTDLTEIHDDTGVIIDCTKEQNCIHLNGFDPGIKEAEKKISNLQDKITVCEYVTDKKKYQMLIKPSDNGKFQRSAEKEYRCKIDIADGYMVDKQQKYRDHGCWMGDNMSIQHVEGSITNIEADIVLCPVKSGLKPKKAGQQIFDAYKFQLAKLTDNLRGSKASNSNIKTYKYILKAMNDIYPFKCVGLILLEGGMGATEGDIQLFKNIFIEAIKEGYITVAIPLKKGKSKTFNYCVKGIARSLLELRRISSSQREILPFYLHVYLTTDDDKTTQCLHEMLQEELKEKKFHELDLQFLQEREENEDSVSPISLEIVQGNLTDDHLLKEVGMIVNSVDEKLSFSGGISSRILKHAGSSLKDQCPKELSYGEVVTTSGGFLPCKICHGVLLPIWLNRESIAVKVLKCVVLKSMEMAEKERCTQIAFPALGTGNLGYPYHVVSEVMISSVEKYGREHPNTCIQKVKIVVWKDDQKTLKALESCQIRRDCFLNNPVFIELTPGIDTETVWLEAIRDDYYPVKIQLFQKSAIRYEETKVVVYITDSSKHQSQPTYQDADINYTYNLIKDQYEISIAYQDRNFEHLIEKCLNFTSENRLLSIAFDVVAKDVLPQEEFVKLAQTLKNIVLNHTIEKVDIVKIYLDVEENILDLCCKADHASESWLSLEKYRNLLNTKVNWSKKICDMRQCLKKAVKISVASEKFDNGKTAMNCLQNMVNKKRQQTGATNSEVSSEFKSGTANLGAQAEPTPSKPNMMLSVDSKSLKEKTRSFVGKCKTLVDKSKLFCGLTNEREDHAERSIDKTELICKVTAEVNPGFLKLDDEALKKIQDEINSKWNVELVIDREKRSMKLEGCNFEDVKKVNSYLENKVEEMNKSEYKRTDSIGSDFTGVDILKITRSEFDTLMYFWGDEYMIAHKDVKISYDSDQKVFVQCDQTESENLKMEINREIEKIRKMTDTETIFEKSQIEKAKSCLQTLQSEFKEVYFFLDEDKLILHAVGDYNYTLKQTLSHRAKILTGQIKETKRGRRFAAGEDISVGQNDGHSGQDEYRSMPSSLPSHDSMRSSTRGQNRNTDEKKKFTTKEGIDIYVYSESILQLDVDCIVNAANERLGHGAGVAAVISNAAGYELEQEGKEYIQRYGPIPVGECCHTTAGRLPYRHVIHTVGPRWNNSMNFEEQKQCKKELQNAIESCFNKADTLEMKSIGVPSVSAGIFGMPPYICAKQYLEAVLNYSQQRTWSSKPTTLKEIHFIDMNIEMCKQIADVFSKCGDFKEAGLSVGSKPSNISTSSRHSFSHSSYSRSLSNSSFDRNDDEAYSSSVEMLFRPCSWITIHLLQSSITDIKKVSAVVSPENLGFKHQGRISKAILDKADEDFRDKVEVMKDRPTSITSVFSVDCSKEMPWKCVLYSIAPHLDSKYKQNIQQFETDLKDTVVNILSEAAIKGLESLAIPLLGTAVSGMKTPMDSCCHAMLDGIWSIINRGTRKKNWKLDLWIVTTDQDAIHTFEKMLNSKTGSKLTNTNPDFGSSKVENQKTDDNTLDEDCCICMDKITDPKWLPCKHVFCTDCIDQQFKFKPACPQCGAVHGIVTGDQPPGSMSRIKQNFSLPGYPECKTIAITYTFSSGYQTEEHPNPGKFYSGIERTGFLPDNEKGRLVAKLLRVAFDRRLVFTIGRSRTTGQEGVITWNDIHHKTRTHGGQQSFGYPDDTYLDRVLDELAAKGVTKDSLNK